MAGAVSVSATRSLRIRYRTLVNGRKELVDCTRHYDR